MYVRRKIASTEGWHACFKLYDGMDAQESCRPEELVKLTREYAKRFGIDTLGFLTVLGFDLPNGNVRVVALGTEVHHLLTGDLAPLPSDRVSVRDAQRVFREMGITPERLEEREDILGDAGFSMTMLFFDTKGNLKPSFTGGLPSQAMIEHGLRSNADNVAQRRQERRDASIRREKEIEDSLDEFYRVVKKLCGSRNDLLALFRFTDAFAREAEKNEWTIRIRSSLVSVAEIKRLWDHLSSHQNHKRFFNPKRRSQAESDVEFELLNPHNVREMNRFLQKK